MLTLTSLASFKLTSPSAARILASEDIGLSVQALSGGRRPREGAMQIEIEVEEKGEVVRTISSNAEPHETLEGVLRRTAPQLAVDIDELLADIAVDGKVLSGQDTVAEALSQGRRLRHRRVCVELRFETETITHLFPAAG